MEILFCFDMVWFFSSGQQVQNVLQKERWKYLAKGPERNNDIQYSQSIEMESAFQTLKNGG